MLLHFGRFISAATTALAAIESPHFYKGFSSPVDPLCLRVSHYFETEYLPQPLEASLPLFWIEILSSYHVLFCFFNFLKYLKYLGLLFPPHVLSHAMWLAVFLLQLWEIFLFKSAQNTTSCELKNLFVGDFLNWHFHQPFFFLFSVYVCLI